MSRTNLMLVSPWASLRPPLPLGSRPELAAAFELGERDRAAGRRPGDEMTREQLERLMALAPDERNAYLLGVAGDQALRAPAALPLALALVGLEFLAGTLLEAPGPRRRRLIRFPVGFAAIWLSQRTLDRAEHRRALVLGLTPATMPRSSHPAQLFGPLVLALAHQLWCRLQFGRRPRVSRPAMLAAAGVRALRRRHDWTNAYQRGLSQTAQSRVGRT